MRRRWLFPRYMWILPNAGRAVYARYGARPDYKPPEFTPLSDTGPVARSERQGFRRLCVLRGRRAGRGARIRRHLGDEPRNNGAGPGVIHPNILLRPVIALSGGSILRRCVAGTRVPAAFNAENPRILQARQ